MATIRKILHFLEVHFDLTEFGVGMGSRVVYQGGKLPLSHFARSKSEHKEERVNDIGLSRSIWSNNRREGCVERTDFLATCVPLEVCENEICYDESGSKSRPLFDFRQCRLACPD